MNTEAALSVESAATTPAVVGEPFAVTVAANKLGVPIKLTTSMPVTLSLVDEASGTLTGNELLLADGVDSARLLVSGAPAGSFEFATEMLVPNGVNVASGNTVGAEGELAQTGASGNWAPLAAAALIAAGVAVALVARKRGAAEERAI